MPWLSDLAAKKSEKNKMDLGGMELMIKPMLVKRKLNCWKYRSRFGPRLVSTVGGSYVAFLF